MSKVGQVVISYLKDKKLLHIKADGWKLGEEKLLIAVLEQSANYFKSPQFRKTIINAIHKRIELGKRGKGDKPPFHYK